MVGKLVHYLQGISLHCDPGVRPHCERCWLVHNLHLLCTDGQAKCVAHREELAHAPLQPCF